MYKLILGMSEIPKMKSLAASMPTSPI